MTPAARLQAAIDILAALDGGRQPLERVLKEFFRARRYAGSKDRRAISEQVYHVMRHRAELAHRMSGDDDARALVIASLLDEGGDPDTLFTGGYAPAPLTDRERARIVATPPPPPPHVAGAYPPWLEPELVRSLDDVAVEMAALKKRAPVDLRVNTLKASRPDVLAALKAEGFSAQPTPWSPVGIRIPPGEGQASLSKTPLFLSGAFEFQDEAAQIASLLADARPGMRVLDLAAGAGGKALAMAAAMQNRGEILAFDEDPHRLAPLAERARRAGATCIVAADRRGGPLWGDGRFDLVFLDAPCGGTGTWRRQPDLRWRTAPAWLDHLNRIQDQLLDEAGRHTAPGGRMVYATCSILRRENEDRVEAFLTRNPDFSRLSAAAGWTGPLPPGLSTDFRASPARTGTDGFYCAVLGRT